MAVLARGDLDHFCAAELGQGFPGCGSVCRLAGILRRVLSRQLVDYQLTVAVHLKNVYPTVEGTFETADEGPVLCFVV